MLPACLRPLVIAHLPLCSVAVNSLWSTDRTCLAFGRILRLETFCIQARCFAKKRVRIVCATRHAFCDCVATRVVQGGGASCQVFCGYHNDISGQIFYAVMPYPGCTGCTGSLDTFTALTSTSSHDYAKQLLTPFQVRVGSMIRMAKSATFAHGKQRR
jgi:hypothetical protein